MKPSPLRPESLSPDVFLALCSFDSHLSPLNIFVVMLWTFSGLHICLSEGEELMLLRHINILFTGRILEKVSSIPSVSMQHLILVTMWKCPYGSPKDY